jgi:hypothetical protein
MLLTTEPPAFILPGMGKTTAARGPADGFTRMTFDLEEALRDELRILAAMEKRPMGELLRQWTKAGIVVLQRKHGRK